MFCDASIEKSIDTLGKHFTLAHDIYNPWPPSHTIQILSLPASKFLKDLSASLSPYVSLPSSPSRLICITSVFYRIYAYNGILYFSWSTTETVTVLRSLCECNKPLLPDWLQTTECAVSHHLFIVTHCRKGRRFNHSHPIGTTKLYL